MLAIRLIFCCITVSICKKTADVFISRSDRLEAMDTAYILVQRQGFVRKLFYKHFTVSTFLTLQQKDIMACW